MRVFFLPIFLATFLPGAAIAAPGQVGASPSSLDKIPEYLPYNVVSLFQFSIPPLRYGQLGEPVSLVNVDDDPELEIFRSKNSYLLCEEYSSEKYVIHWQLNLQAEFYSQKSNKAAFSVTGALDLGAENPMVVASGSTSDFMVNRFWVINPQTGNIESRFDLPSGPDLNGDNRWDGSYFIIGAMTVSGKSGPHQALIIGCKVGFDLEKRGVYAVDPWTGEILWDFLPGSSLTTHLCQILDLDGDGTEEVLLTSISPHNLGGRKINGFSDDRPYLFALGADGALLWSRELAPDPGSTYLQTGDLDGDGKLEIVTLVSKTYSNQSLISVWDSQGNLKASLTREHNLSNCLLVPSDQNNHLNIITGNRFSSIISLRLDNDQLVLQKEAANSRGISILGLVDLPGKTNGMVGKGIITQDRDGQGRILDSDFNIIASYLDDPRKFSRQVITGWMGDKPSFILLGSKLGCNTLEPNPLTLAGIFTRYLHNPRLLVLLGLGLGLIFAWLIWFFSRRNQEKPVPLVFPESSNPLHLQERRLHLLEDLEISNHGAMAPLRSLRRLLWMLDAVQSGVGVNPNLVARMKEIWQDCHEDALPRLTNILERARLAQVSESVVDESLASLCRINAALNNLNNDSFTADSVSLHLATLHKEEKTTEALLQSLRRQVSDFFKTPLPVVLEKVLRAHSDTLEKLEVKMQTGMVAAAEAGASSPNPTTEIPICRMDAGELGFILDNLVGNACRAMASAPRRELRITWQPVGGMVQIEVTDTGIGIATEDHQRVLEPGFSTRPGGGLGLPKSQRLLKKYDGHLSIKHSQPGQGTTFSLVVPRA